MFREYHQKLVDIGLSEKQAIVYTTLLQNGSSTADQIAKSAKIKRSTVYVQLQELAAMGLTSSFKKGKKTLFVAESPNNIERLLKKKQEEVGLRMVSAKSFLPDLLKAYSGVDTRPEVRIFEGKEGLISMRSAVLDEKPSRIKVVTVYDKLLEVFSKDELRAFSERRARLGIESLAIYSYSAEEDAQLSGMQTMKRVSRDQLPFTSDVYIYNNSVSFASISETITGVTIRNENISKTVEALFDFTWKSL